MAGYAEIDAEAVAFARRVLARQPRADNTIAQLPSGGNVQGTDLVPVARNGGVVNVAASTFLEIQGTSISANLVTFPNTLPLAAPSFSTSSSGTRILLFPDEGASAVDFAIGMMPSAMWLSIPAATNTYYFNFYAGTTLVAFIRGDGVVSAAQFNANTSISSPIFTSSNYFNFSIGAGLGPPTFNTSSNGTRVLLYPNETSTTVDFAIGMNNNQVWVSLSNNNGNSNFAIYGGVTQVASIDSAGNLSGNSIAVQNGVTGGVQYSTGAGAYSGNGAPSFAAHKGSIYLRGDGTTGTSFYVNYGGTSGSWTAVA